MKWGKKVFSAKNEGFSCLQKQDVFDFESLKKHVTNAAPASIDELPPPFVEVCDASDVAISAT